MASAILSEELLCSICLTLYTDPVTLRCGHNFCRECIDRVLDTQDGSGDYSCPECREEFKERPTLKRNITLCNVAERFLSSQPHQEEITGIRCTYCIHSPVPAVRSCLHCEASLCDNHLRVHSKGPEHVLTDPSTSLENRKCSVHKKILEYYCTEDAACICVYCSAEEHRGHRVEMLDEAFEKKKKNLRNVLQKLITNRKKTEERVQSLEENRRKAQDKASGEAEKVTALFKDIRRRVDDLEKKVLSEISRREQQMSQSLSDAIQKLEIKKDELSRKMRHIEELCNMTDPLTVLQEPETGDLCDPEEDGGDEDTGGHDGGDEDTGGHDGGDEDTGGHDGGDEDTGGHDGSDEDTGGHDGGDEDTGGHDGGDEDTGGHDGGDEDTGGHDGGDEDTGGHDGGDRGAELISHISHTLSDIIRGINVIFYVQDPADILLDVNTAANNLLISDDLKTVTWTRITQNCPETAERFQGNQVMSRRGFTSGRHYWDVEISGSGRWRVGMCYPSIDRRGHQSYIGNNNKSWCVYIGWGYNNQCSVRHDSDEIQLPQQIPSDRVRICLDYEAGQLSFYALCDPIRHLHTFTAAFSEPLHAALWVWTGSIKISWNKSIR
ncbi:E3 ubiquitin/ISG15 ligase TRIM25-like [Anomaloglossus baeobatrachus]|uniref:E3 ubiquitin/ISG15 ligase TRIM25-like n=1 Tax=Anomaloglossus baeobatrachus TaxID=238106 RepID=UPI003F4FB110